MNRPRRFLILALCVISVLVLRPRREAGKGDPGERPSDWFTRQRAYPYPRIPEPARRDAFREALAMKTEHALRAGRERALQGLGDHGPEPAAAGLGAWQPAGPTNVGGRVTAIAARSASPDTVYMGAAAGGVFRSVDDGATWTPIFDHVSNLSVGALAVSPDDVNTLYVGTGEANAAGDTYGGDGVWRTADGGQTWEHLGLEATARIGRIVVDPANPARIFVAAMGRLHGTNPERGLYRSLDAGSSWTRVLSINDTTGVIDVALNPVNPDELYAAAWQRLRSPSDRIVGGYGSGIYKSVNGGDTWSRLGAANGLPDPAPDNGRIGVSVAASQPSTVYAFLIDDPGWLMGIYRSTDSGGSWTRIDDAGTADIVADFGWYFAQIRADPTGPDRVYALGVTAHRSANGGSSWSEIGSSMHADHHALWIDPGDPGHMYMGNDGGFYRTTNGGTGWTKSTDLPITQFYHVTVDYQLPYRIYGGAQDNNSPGTQSGLADDWDTFYYGDGFYTLVDPRDSDVFYVEAQYGKLAKTTNGGKKFNACRSGILSLDRRNWSTPVVMDPVNPDVMYYGTYRVYRTADAAGTWTAISGDLTGGEDPGILEFGTITTLGVTAADSQTVMAGTDDGRVWITRDGGSSWTDISAGLPDRWVTRVAVDPADAMRVYVTLSGFHVDSPLPHVFISDDGGATWNAIASNLPPVPLNDIVIDPANTNRLYLGSDAGVFWSANRGASWQPLGVGFPNAPVHSLCLHDPSRTLVAGTHGRSTYTYVLGTPTAATEPAAPPAFRVAAAPNPAPGPVTLTFTLRREGRVTVEIFDLRGALVSRVADERFPEGPVSVRWDMRDRSGRPAAAGTYFYRVRTREGVRVGKIVRIR